MKRVIDGKLYNTETAEKLLEHSEGYASDFRHFDEALYRTKKGAYFIVGKGGPLSHYSRPNGNNGSRSGSGLRLVSEEDARAYVEAHGSAADYARIFGEPEEG